MPVNVTIKPAGRALALAKGLPVILTFDEKTAEQVTIGDVKSALQAKFPRKFSLEGSKNALDDEKTLIETSSENKSAASGSFTLTVKDLGPQVSWRTVFLVEYAGPLIIHPLIYLFPQVFYRTTFEHSQLQTLTYVLVLLHFLKRELETLFVHRFSHATMPLRNIFKNSAHYHILSGILLAGGVYGPWYSRKALAGSLRANPTFLAACTGVWLVAEALNFHAHLTVRNLRPAGTKTRGIPRGGLFELVSVPNYFTEVVAWTAITVMTQSPFAVLFLVVSTGQMAIWAAKKHRGYKKEFGSNYPKGRKAMFPFIF
ncbi:3-oxo-5-alpha-steroid 4-dehydrogenase-domain-containing protein [Cantharellus anzutake]|uniref:3-oxo-5-alpha-steroid 4-dehydrogenase-domain-containing protein n=1 Tax=Cantharellus anzutake TaxID=1750568 RepID=UPI001902C4C6|nr:3-oxo-5-alpha-steroid 4-dehydrogenase-domain-containing protein [Cantharellus anzutake]KAF8339664.1 3-oxo-5-alpha-steroid 4-dehydrogenase-domain-containing protein [Cantharellus anzutake]